MYVHVCKLETLRAAYVLAQKNDGAPGVDGVTFAAIKAQGVEAFLVQIRDELVRRTYAPLPARRQEIPKDGGKVRVLSIPAIRDRVVQGALKLILEPIFEADFQPGSFGYRPKRTAHEAVDRVAKAISAGCAAVGAYGVSRSGPSPRPNSACASPVGCPEQPSQLVPSMLGFAVSSSLL